MGSFILHTTKLFKCVDYPFYLISQNKIVLVDLLEREPLARLPVLDQVHCAVRPVGHELDNLKVLLTRRLGLELDLWMSVLKSRDLY